MRKVLYKKWNAAVYADNILVWKAGWDILFVHHGTFLAYGINSEEVSTGVLTNTVLLIETEDNRIEEVLPCNILFVD